MIGGMIKEFRDFAIKGNAFDLAVGVILGTAFGAVVASLTNDIILQLIAKIFGKSSFVGEITLLNMRLGSFINVVINFIITAFALFILVKAFNAVKKRMEAEKAAPPPAGPTVDQKLLTEIRDLLAKR
jgi:large conductance mechanosensitive channel